MSFTRQEPFLLSDRELAELVLEEMEAALVICDRNLSILLANAPARLLCDGDPVGKKFNQVFPIRWAPLHEQPSDALGVQPGESVNLTPVLEGSPVRGLGGLTSSDRSVQELYLRSAPYRGTHEEVICCIVSMLPVTKPTSGRVSQEKVPGAGGAAHDHQALRQTRTELAQRAALLDLSPDAKSAHSFDGKIMYWNRGAEKMYGWSKAEAMGRVIWDLLGTAYPTPREQIHAQLSTEREWKGELVQRTRSGELITVASQQVVQYDAEGRPLAILEIDQDLRERRRIEQQREFLVQATNLFATSLDYRTTLEHIVQVAVPFLADWCVVHVLTEDGNVQRLASAHRDPAKLELITERFPEYPLDQNAQYLAAHVLRTGEPEVINEVTDEILQGAARDADHLRLLRALETEAYMCLPLVARGERLGAVTFGISSSGRRYTRHEVELAQELLRRAALAVDNARSYQASQNARARLELVSHVSIELMTTLDAQASMERLTELLVPQFADWCAVNLVQPDGTIRLSAARAADPAKAALLKEWAERAPVTPADTRGTPQVIRTGQPELVTDVDHLVTASPDKGGSLRSEYAKRLGTHSYIIVPLNARGRIFGAITVARTSAQPSYTLEDLLIAEEIARRAALALDNAELYRQEQHARREIEENAARIAALQQITAALTAAVTRQQVARVVLEQGSQALAAQGGIVLRLRDDGTTTELVSAVGYSSEILVELREMRVSPSGPIGDVVIRGKTLVFANRQELERAYPNVPPPRSEYKAWMIMPLLIDTSVLGALVFSFVEPRTFNEADMAFARALAQQCAQAMERARLYESERGARRAAERAARRSEWLTEASQLLASSLDYHKTFKQLAELAVPELADWCQIHIAKPDGTAQQLVLAHKDPALLKWAEEFAATVRQYFSNEDTSRGLAHVLRTGRPEIYYSITDAQLEAVAKNEAQLNILRQIGFSSAMIVPLNSQSGTLGAITLVNTESRRHFSDDDLAFAELLAGRAAVAIENANLYQATQQLNAELEQRVMERTYELSEAYEEVRALAAQLQTIREEERADIARELHDELGQSLTALKMDVAALISRLPKRNQSLLERARSMSAQIDATIKTVRRLSSQLRPGMLDDLGLAPSIEWYAIDFKERTNIEVAVQVPEQDLPLNRDQATALFRIFQETLTNVARHADAMHVDVQVCFENSDLVLRVRDDGRGIDLHQAHGKRSLGLVGMRERAEMIGGNLEIQGEPGKGTTVTVRVPLAEPAPLGEMAVSSQGTD